MSYAMHSDRTREQNCTSKHANLFEGVVFQGAILSDHFWRLCFTVKLQIFVALIVAYKQKKIITNRSLGYD